jgi:hypothetical protein
VRHSFPDEAERDLLPSVVVRVFVAILIVLQPLLQDFPIGAVEPDEARAEQRLGCVWRAGKEEKKDERDADREKAFHCIQVLLHPSASCSFG